MDSNSLKNMKLKELRDIAKSFDIKNVTTFKKDELIEIISKKNAEKTEKAEKAAK